MKLPTQRLRILLLGSVLFAISPNSQGVPNIVVMMLDDVGSESFECYFGNPISTHDTDGDPLIKTPNITALAASGIRFTRAFALPLCTPSRVEILSGRHNFRNYLSFGYMDNQETTFAQVLRANGYATAIAGKWQLSCPNTAPPTGAISPNVTPAVMRDDYGFDQFFLWQLNFTNCTGGRGDRYWSPQQETASADGLTSVVVPATAADYGPARCVDFLKGFISDSAASGTPFLAYFPTALPHNPFVATPDSPDGIGSNTNNRQYYDDNIEYIDTMVGQLVAHLEDPDGVPGTDDSIRENTLFIFTSDNGTNTSITVTNDSGTVNGDKGTCSNYGTHVPMILSWPGTIAPEVSDRPVDFTDVFPTLLDVAGISPAGLGLDGVSLLDADRTADSDKQVAYLWYAPKWSNWPSAQCAMDARFKLYSDGRLFDLIADPSESFDLSGAPPPDAAAALPALQAVIDGYAAEISGPVYHGDAIAVNFWDFDTLDGGVPVDLAGGVTTTAGGNMLLEQGSYGASPRGGDYLKTARASPGVPLSADVATTMDFGAGSFSFSYWSYNDTSDDGGGDLRGIRVFDCLSGSAEGVHVSANDAGVFNMRLDDDAGNTIRSSIDPVPPLNALVQPADRWVQVAVVVNRDPAVRRAELFFDGVSVGSFDLTPLSGQMLPSQLLQIGCINGGGSGGGVQTGGLDDLAFYAGVLTPQQIAALAAGGSATDVAPPSGAAPLRLEIAALSAGTELEFTWNSRAGVRYELLSTTTLQGPRGGWTVVSGDIAATPPSNRLTIVRPAAAQSFYVLRETEDP